MGVEVMKRFKCNFESDDYACLHNNASISAVYHDFSEEDNIKFREFMELYL